MTGLGQYFTTDRSLQDAVTIFIKNRPIDILLEPSIGRGDLVNLIKRDFGNNIIFDLYEIDDSIKPIISEHVVYDDFLNASHGIYYTYKTIVMNPPYVRTKSGNLYIDFIERCFELLDDDHGEMICIVPSDFFKLTASATLLNKLLASGNFTDIYHPHNDRLFHGATIDVLVFRYEKGCLDKNHIVSYNGTPRKIINTNGMVTFMSCGGHNSRRRLGDLFNIYVGMVTGKDEVYKNDIGNINILCGDGISEKFIFVDDKFPSGDDMIDGHLLKNKDVLLSRKIRSFNETNWYEWGAPRNFSAIKKNWGRPCIYIHNLTRKAIVAFIGTVQYFGGNLLMMIPCDLSPDLTTTVQFLNSSDFKEQFIFSGRFKIGHKQLCDSLITV